MSDIYSAPATKAAAVTPDDSTVVGCRALYVGSAGDVAVVPKEGSASVTFANVPAGTILPVSCAKVMATGTTASDILALF